MKKKMTEKTLESIELIKTESHVLKTDGTVEKVTPEDGKHFSLKELQAIVGGYIEILRLSNDVIMVLNEEGKLKGLPFNPNANKIYKDYFNIGNDYLVGNVLLCHPKMVN